MILTATAEAASTIPPGTPPTIIADDGHERCPTCGAPLVERSPTSPAVRYCEPCWWAEQRRRHATGHDVHPLARSVIERTAP